LPSHKESPQRRKWWMDLCLVFYFFKNIFKLTHNIYINVSGIRFT
jgi:hypothetical protein